MEHLPLLGLPPVSGDWRGALSARGLQGQRRDAFTRTPCGCSARMGSARLRIRSTRRPRRQTSAAASASGYYVLAQRTGRPTATIVCFDCGEQAAGHATRRTSPIRCTVTPTVCRLVAWLGGRRVLVDSGLFAYNCGGVWEAHFRETAAHNTATVDGRDQARHLGKMAWSNSYRALPEDWHVGDVAGLGGSDRTTGTLAVRRRPHRRTVWLRHGLSSSPSSTSSSGQGNHEFGVNWQFAPAYSCRRTTAARFRRHRGHCLDRREPWWAATRLRRDGASRRLDCAESRGAAGRRHASR